MLSAMLPLQSGQAVQLLPAGSFSSRDGRPGPGKSWTLTDEQGQAIAASLTATAAGARFLFDYDHQTLRSADNGQPAPAAGWASTFEWRSGQGLFATNAQWTAAAQAAIDAHEFMYVSPVLTYDDAGRVTGVLMAAITNYPALLGMQPLGEALQAIFDRHNAQEHPPMDLLKKLLARLGLPEAPDAATGEAAALSAIDTLKAKADAAAGLPPALPAALVTELGLAPTADAVAALSSVQALKSQGAASAGKDQLIVALNAEVASLKAAGVTGQVERLVDDAIQAGKLTPVSREWAIGYGRSNMVALQAMLTSMPAIIPTAPHAGTPPATGVPPTGTSGVHTAALTGDAKLVATAFGLPEKDFAEKHAALTASR